MGEQPTTKLISTILIAAGIVIMGAVVFRSLQPYLPEQFGVVSQSEGPKKTVKPKQKALLESIKKTKGYLAASEFLKRTDSQLVDGFVSVDYSSNSGSYDSWLGKVLSWWGYSDNEEQMVVWNSAECPEKKRTTLVFSGVLGVGAGEAHLCLNDTLILPFNTGAGPEIEEWGSNALLLKFFALLVKSNQERLGIFCLTLPAEEIIPGESMKLKVTGYQKTGRGNSFFMLSDLPHTLESLDLK